MEQGGKQGQEFSFSQCIIQCENKNIGSFLPPWSGATTELNKSIKDLYLGKHWSEVLLLAVKLEYFLYHLPQTYFHELTHAIIFVFWLWEWDNITYIPLFI